VDPSCYWTAKLGMTSIRTALISPCNSLSLFCLRPTILRPVSADCFGRTTVTCTFSCLAYYPTHLSGPKLVLVHTDSPRPILAGWLLLRLGGI